MVGLLDWTVPTCRVAFGWLGWLDRSSSLRETSRLLSRMKYGNRGIFSCLSFILRGGPNFPENVLRVGLGSGRLGLGSKVLFEAVFDIFRLTILEAHVGQTDFHTVSLSYAVLQKCGKGGSTVPAPRVAVGWLGWLAWLVGPYRRF